MSEANRDNWLISRDRDRIDFNFYRAYCGSVHDYASRALECRYNPPGVGGRDSPGAASSNVAFNAQPDEGGWRLESDRRAERSCVTPRCGIPDTSVSPHGRYHHTSSMQRRDGGGRDSTHDWRNMQPEHDNWRRGGVGVCDRVQIPRQDLQYENYSPVRRSNAGTNQQPFSSNSLESNNKNSKIISSRPPTRTRLPSNSNTGTGTSKDNTRATIKSNSSGAKPKVNNLSKARDDKNKRKEFDQKRTSSSDIKVPAVDHTLKRTKHRSEYNENKRRYSRALNILEKAEESIRKGEIQTPTHRASQSWAKEQVKIFEDMKKEREKSLANKPPSEKAIASDTISAPIKRNRCSEESRIAKRLKSSAPTILDKVPFNEVENRHLKVGLVDASKPDLKISPENFVKINTQLVVEVLKKKRAGIITSMPTFDITESYSGFNVITASSLKDLETLRMIIVDLGEIWEGAKIEIRNLAELPRPPKVKISFPGEYTDARDVIEVLELTNPNINVSTWSVINSVEHKDGRTVIFFRISSESLKKLQKQSMKLGFGLYWLQVTLIGTNAQENDQDDSPSLDLHK